LRKESTPTIKRDRAVDSNARENSPKPPLHALISLEHPSID